MTPYPALSKLLVAVGFWSGIRWKFRAVPRRRLPQDLTPGVYKLASAYSWMAGSSPAKEHLKKRNPGPKAARPTCLYQHDEPRH